MTLPERPHMLTPGTNSFRPSILRGHRFHELKQNYKQKHLTVHVFPPCTTSFSYGIGYTSNRGIKCRVARHNEYDRPNVQESVTMTETKGGI